MQHSWTVHCKERHGIDIQRSTKLVFTETAFLFPFQYGNRCC